MTSRTAYSTWTPQKPTLFDGHYLRNRSTLDISVLGYIGIVQHKEHSPEVWSVPPVTLCISNVTNTYSECVMFNVSHRNIGHVTKLQCYVMRTLPFLFNFKLAIHKVTTWLDRFVFGKWGRRGGMSWHDVSTIQTSVAIHLVVS